MQSGICVSKDRTWSSCISLISVRVVAGAGDAIQALANIMVMQTTLEGVTSIYAVGRYDDTLLERDCGFIIRRKQVILDTFAIDNMLAVPL